MDFLADRINTNYDVLRKINAEVDIYQEYGIWEEKFPRDLNGVKRKQVPGMQNNSDIFQFRDSGLVDKINY